MLVNQRESRVPICNCVQGELGTRTITASDLLALHNTTSINPVRKLATAHNIHDPHVGVHTAWPISHSLHHAMGSSS
jgi:hypothetical protein